MSYKAIFQFILHIDSFHVISLPHQGLLCVQASIYQQDKQGKHYALPYEVPKQRPGDPMHNPRKITGEAKIGDQCFCSKVIIVKYSDQIITIDDFACFRLDLEAFPTLVSEDIFLQLDLKLARLGETDTLHNIVDSIRFRLRDLSNGIISYCEGQFDQPNFSRVNFQLVGFLTTYRFERYRSEQVKDKQRQGVASLERMIPWSVRFFKAGLNPLHVFYTNYVKNLCHSIYLIERKINEVLLVKRQFVPRLPLSYLQARKVTANSVDETSLRQFLVHYVPMDITLDGISKEIYELHSFAFALQQEVIEDFMHQNIDKEKMVNLFREFEREKYGERVFKSLVQAERTDDVTKTFDENKKIAKSIRKKDIVLTEYPLEYDHMFDKKPELEIVFYQVIRSQNGKKQKEQMSLKEQKNERKGDERGAVEGSKIQESEVKERILSESTAERSTIEKSESMNDSTKKEVPLNKLNIPQHLQYSERNMLIVLCHGFQGSSYDMGRIHRWIREILPEANYLVSRANENSTEGDIRQMGQKLAIEIEKYVSDFYEQDQERIIINMVGHSMGGIIARASLKHLQAKFRNNFGFFCSLSSPHLGYLNGVSNLIKLGLWAIRTWKTIVSLKQLSMAERNNHRSTFLYELSHQGSLKYFRKIILLSSFQDNYVSWHSARISPHSSSNQNAKVEQEMVDNILGGNIYNASVHRIDVNFNVKGKNVDRMIGRAAHINLITQDSLFRMITQTIPELFQLKEDELDELNGARLFN